MGYITRVVLKLILHLLQHGQIKYFGYFDLFKLDGRRFEGKPHGEVELRVHQQCSLQEQKYMSKKFWKPQFAILGRKPWSGRNQNIPCDFWNKFRSLNQSPKSCMQCLLVFVGGFKLSSMTIFCMPILSRPAALLTFSYLWNIFTQPSKTLHKILLFELTVFISCVKSSYLANTADDKFSVCLMSLVKNLI